MARRVGPSMEAAKEYVRLHPGCTMHEVAKAVGPHGSSAYGYEIVHRAIGAGLIQNRAAFNEYSQLYVKGSDHDEQDTAPDHSEVAPTEGHRA